MHYSLVIAGLEPAHFDRVKMISGKRLAPKGNLVITPLSKGAGYSEKYVQSLLATVCDYAKTRREDEPLSTMLLYVNRDDASTRGLLESFFPFALPLRLQIPPLRSESKRRLNESLNEAAQTVIQASDELRKRVRLISEHTHIHNLTPLLLPLRNFKSKVLVSSLRQLYSQLASSEDPNALIKSTRDVLAKEHPRTQAPGEQRHCFSDGVLYFRSPGRHRHGFFRNVGADIHRPECLLSARSRLGGSYAHNFHYDCIPHKTLAKAYDDCHGESRAVTATTHVNIAPNDFII